MLFNSYPFILLFLPVALLGYFALGRMAGRHLVFGWLTLVSLFFYGWWNWFNLALLLTSLVFNYAAGTWLGRLERKPPAKGVLGVALAFNLGFLGYFKYANFFIENVNSAFGVNWAFTHVALPLGISFYTFQKIAYLVDSYQGRTRGYGFGDFCLFVSFFPQLIAGPITHHGEIMPQFRRHDSSRVNWDDLSVGFTLFALGLGKKVLIADRFAGTASAIFREAQRGAEFGFTEAWLGALTYTLQLYFDFSGYSDMAIGLARLFGIRLPMNFNSPYQAANIADFWRRWHMTLSRFLRDHLYIPLGGNRCAPWRKYLNLFLTMLIGGIWHGAGWTYVIWGALHGTYLLLFHAWREARGGKPSTPAGIILGRGLTFLVVVIAWIFFRADSFSAAMKMLSGMAGLHGFSSNWAAVKVGEAWRWTGLFLLVVWCLPNTNQMLARFQPTLEFLDRQAPVEAKTPRWWRRGEWQPNWLWLFGVVALVLFAIIGLSRVSEFIYWQF